MHKISARMAGAIAVVTLAHFARLVAGAREHWIAFVPDDAFYYLGFGRGFATTGRWTFDGGVSLSSGFHLLQAYLAAACWALFHGLGADGPVYGLMVASVLCNLLAVCVCVRLVSRIFGAHASIGVALVFLGKNALICGASGMKWSAAVLTLALATEIAVIPSEPSLRRTLEACGVGLLAVIARSDSAVWIGILAAASLLTHRSASAAKVGALVLGSALGVLAIGVHSHAITGVWLQDSVLAKLHWGKLQGIDVSSALNMLAMTTGVGWLGKGIDRGVLLALLLLGFVGAAFTRADKRAALLASSGILLGALALGARNSGGLQYWYTDAAVVPCCLLWSAAFAEAQQRLAPRVGWALAFGVAVSCVANFWFPRAGPWPNQLAMLRAGLHLDSEAWSACRVGAWNAGIIGYYRGHDVINLDGLANHDALIASKSGQLSKYLANSDVHYIVDFAAMMERPEFRARGGYDHPGDELLLTEVERAPDTDPRWLSSPIMYWRLQPPDLARLPDSECQKAR